MFFFCCFVTLSNPLNNLFQNRLLLGLKDCNDELASKTFLCLSIMVKLLGSEVVIGSSFKNDKNEKIKFFSNSLPKVIF